MRHIAHNGEISNAQTAIPACSKTADFLLANGPCWPTGSAQRCPRASDRSYKIAMLPTTPLKSCDVYQEIDRKSV